MGSDAATPDADQPTNDPPRMAAWNLALRFGIEVAALVGIARLGWVLTTGPLRWVAMIGLSVAAATIWGTLNVPDDPSRSGAAPVEVSGSVRLAVELFVLGGGCVAFALVGHIGVALVLAFLIIVHYVSSRRRIVWLLNQ